MVYRLISTYFIDLTVSSAHYQKLKWSYNSTRGIENIIKSPETKIL